MQEFERWKAEVEGLRSKMKRQAVDALSKSRLAAMTTTRAVFTYDEIAALGPFDLVVFDEASQVGLAHVAGAGAAGQVPRSSRAIRGSLLRS